MGKNIEEPIKWALRQRKSIVKDADDDDPRRIGWNDKFGDAADELDKIDDFERYVVGLST